MIMKVNLFDFDNTIYDGDSTIDFYFFCLKRNKKIILLLPKQILAFLKYKLGIISKEHMKEIFYSFLKKVDDIDYLVDEFWKISKKKIKKFYLEKDHSNDVIISASPQFLLEPIAKELKIHKLIASKVDNKSGKLLSPNCYGVEKVRRLNEECNNIFVFKAFSDSLSDKPILDLAQRAYIVKKYKIIIYNNKNC